MSSEKWIEFYCDACERDFSCKMLPEEPDPECPTCWRREKAEGRFQEMLDSGIPPAMSKGIHGADIAYKMLEQDTGITNLKDNLREGDVAYKADAPRSREEENSIIRSELRMMEAKAKAPAQGPVQSSWGDQPQRANVNMGQVHAMGKQYTEAQKAQGGADNWAVMDAAKKATSPKRMFRPIAAADRNGNVIPVGVRRR